MLAWLAWLAFQQLISKARLASVLQAASLAATAVAHRSRGVVATSILTARFFARVSSRRRRLLERGRGWAAQKLHPLLPSIVGTMPHVAAYGILLVQALFFFLGGIRQRSNHSYALIGRLLHAQASATTS